MAKIFCGFKYFVEFRKGLFLVHYTSRAFFEIYIFFIATIDIESFTDAMEY